MSTKPQTAAERAAEAIYKLSWSDSSMPVMTDEGKREVGRMSAIIAREYSELESKCENLFVALSLYHGTEPSVETAGRIDEEHGSAIAHAYFDLTKALERVRGQQ